MPFKMQYYCYDQDVMKFGTTEYDLTMEKSKTSLRMIQVKKYKTQNRKIKTIKKKKVEKSNEVSIGPQLPFGWVKLSTSGNGQPYDRTINEISQRLDATKVSKVGLIGNRFEIYVFMSLFLLDSSTRCEFFVEKKTETYFQKNLNRFIFNNLIIIF